MEGCQMSTPGYLTFTHGGVPDRKIIEDYCNALARARKEGERVAMRKLKAALADAETAKLLAQMESSPMPSDFRCPGCGRDHCDDPNCGKGTPDDLEPPVTLPDGDEDE